MKTLQPQAIAIPWYEAGTYQQLRQLMLDGSNLPVSHAEWLAKAMQVEARVIAAGHRPVRVTIVWAAFSAWCAERGLNVNGDGRTEYASFVAKQLVADD